MTRTPWDLFIDTLTIINSAVLASVVIGGMAVNPTPPGPDHPKPPTPVSDTVKVGHAYGVTLAGTYADAWEGAAKDNDAGKPMATIQANLQATWQAARVSTFTRDVSPVFAAIVPEQTESNANPKWSKAARDFAMGLRTVK